MGNVWVYKDDGTLQCGMGKEIPVEVMQNDLAGLIGAKQIQRSEKRQLPAFLPDLCGFRTGAVNAYEITEEGARILFNGFVGQMGFELWIWADREESHARALAGGASLMDDRFVPFPWRKLPGKEAEAVLAGFFETSSSVDRQPVMIRELLGRPCRFLKHDDATTMDWRPDRVNIRTDEKGMIAKIWFG